MSNLEPFYKMMSYFFYCRLAMEHSMNKLAVFVKIFDSAIEYDEIRRHFCKIIHLQTNNSN